VTKLSTSGPDADARQALRLLGPDPQNWVPDRDGIDHNVTVVGGGQSGCALAFALRRAGIGQVSVIDLAGPEEAGIWLTTARMSVLRTPKNLPGPELGITALGFQSWYEARHGQRAYASLERIPRTAWAEYLGWYRRFLAIPVRYHTRLTRIEPARGYFRLHLGVDGSATIETTRKIILANGFGGNGGAYIPPVLSRGVPADRHAHTADAIDFTALQGKDVAVVGAAASAFDAAAGALEAGAALVHLFARRPALASLPVARTRGYPGVYDNYPALPDAVRWRQALRFRQAGSTPPADTIERVLRFPNFHLHLAAPWLSAGVEAGRIMVRAAGEEFRFDFAIAGTGYVVDLCGCPELADFADQILLWRDRFVPPDGEEDAFLGAHPYLGNGQEFLEKSPGTAPFLRDIHVHNPAGFVSFGVPVGDVPSMKRGIPAVVARISHDLFFGDLETHEKRLDGEVAPEFAAELYAPALWISPTV